MLKENSNRVKYTVAVTTADERGAGTDSGIYIRLYGENDEETILQRMEDPEYNDFEQGSTHSYTIYADKDLGEINKIYLESDMRGSYADWKVSKVKVSLEDDSDNEYIFEETHEFDSNDKFRYFYRTN